MLSELLRKTLHPTDAPLSLASSVLETLRRALPEGTTWEAYQNQALDSSTAGQIVFLKVGPECTHKKPPPHAPDGSYGLGWKYLWVGTLSPDGASILRGKLPAVPVVEAPEPEPPPSKPRKRRKIP